MTRDKGRVVFAFSVYSDRKFCVALQSNERDRTTANYSLHSNLCLFVELRAGFRALGRNSSVKGLRAAQDPGPVRVGERAFGETPQSRVAEAQ